MTMKPSKAPWADGPYKVITTPLTYRDVDSHSAVWCASEMSYSHNCLLRGLNSILLQAPHVPSSASHQAYIEQDVKDLLSFVVSWVKTVEWHHFTEEEIMFPAIEKMTGQAGLLSGPKHQHEAFHDPLVELREYAIEYQTKPRDYRWEKMKSILDVLAPPLTQHLYEEIDVFLTFDQYDSDGLRACWDAAEEVAKAKGRISFLYDIFPCVLGSCDKTYEGGNQFPPLPSFMPYAIKYWFGAYNPGAWRFLCCDFWGRPKALEMMPKEVCTVKIVA